MLKVTSVKWATANMRLTKSGTRPCGLPCGGEQARTASPSDRDFVKRRIVRQCKATRIRVNYKNILIE